MSDAKNNESGLSLCGCGGPLRYSHFKDGKEKMSCNKYGVCLTYDEQRDALVKTHNEATKYRNTLQKIVDVNGMDYEYRAWAKDALST